MILAADAVADVLVPLAAVSITVSGPFIIRALTRLRARNTEEHNRVIARLNQLERSHRRLENALLGMIEVLAPALVRRFVDGHYDLEEEDPADGINIS